MKDSKIAKYPVSVAKIGIDTAENKLRKDAEKETIQMPSLVILTAGENNGCLQAEALRQLRGEKKNAQGTPSHGCRLVDG